MKKVKIFNGRWRHNGHAYVGAYSQQHAIDLLNKVNDGNGWRMTLSELQKYWSKGCWGNAMIGIEPEVGVWIQEDRFKSPVKRLI